MTKFEQLEAIAKKQLEIPTLEERKSDRLDFHEVSVWGLLNALERAYEAGRDAGRDEEATRAAEDAAGESI